MSAPVHRQGAIKDVAAGGVLLVVAGLYHWQTLKISQSSLSDDVGPEGLPKLLAVALAVVAALIMVRGLMASVRLRAVSEKADPDADYVSSIPRALGFLAIGIGYILVAPVVGYVIAVALLVAVVAIYEGVAPSWRVAAVAAGAGVLFWGIFVKLLGTEQPIGWFF
ncbi:MAG: tripartite tricarboxylate transporter TctB family protein [Hyphomicrobiales bacterium]